MFAANMLHRWKWRKRSDEQRAAHQALAASSASGSRDDTSDDLLNWDKHCAPRCLCGLLAITHLMPEKFKLENLNYEEILRFRVVSTVCISEVGAHIFGIIGIVVRASSEHIN